MLHMRGLSIIFFTILFASCNSENMDEKSFDYLALGDSYSIGESVDVSERYPVQLKDSLQKHNIKINNLKIVAKTGWTTDELSNGIDSAEFLESYDLVTLLIGVNNQYRGRDLDNYRKEFTELLSRAIQFACDDPEKVIVISIPDWGVTPFAEGRDTAKIAKEIDAYNSVNYQESKNAGVHYVDVTAISREARINKELIAKDGLHPSGNMYSRWVEKVLPLATQILQKKNKE